jgi:hypothetical protein
MFLQQEHQGTTGSQYHSYYRLRGSPSFLRCDRKTLFHEAVKAVQSKAHTFNVQVISLVASAEGEYTSRHSKQIQKCPEKANLPVQKR